MIWLDEKNILERLERLERAVFKEDIHKEDSVNADFMDLMGKVINLIMPFREDYKEKDWLVFQAILPGEGSRADAHLTSFFTLCEEEKDEDVARLCGVLASKQRISIMKEVALNSHSSGELAETMGMAGGHLHHHLRDLLSLGLIKKDDEGRYSATHFGINAYMTAAALHRRLSYTNRQGFKRNLDELDRGKNNKE